MLTLPRPSRPIQCRIRPQQFAAARRRQRRQHCTLPAARPAISVAAETHLTVSHTTGTGWWGAAPHSSNPLCPLPTAWTFCSPIACVTLPSLSSLLPPAYLPTYTSPPCSRRPLGRNPRHRALPAEWQAGASGWDSVREAVLGFHHKQRTTPAATFRFQAGAAVAGKSAALPERS